MSLTVEARHLTKIFGEGAEARRVLDGVTFRVGPGERVGIIGANGAGKSTLLAILAGILTASEGSVNCVGKLHAALTVGFGMREDLTGRENLLIDTEIRGLTRAEAAPLVEKMIAFSELGSFIDRPMRTYSTGMKARLSFASLVLVEPEILIIDETLSVGDRWFSVKATRAIRDLCDRGKIVLLVSHSQADIVEMCSRCLWLESGRLVADGEPATVTRAYTEKIRVAEEAMVVDQLGGETTVWCLDPAVRVERLELLDVRGNTVGATLASDAEVTVNAELSIEREIPEPSIRLFIERGDGIALAQSRMPGRPGIGRLRTGTRLSPIALRPGLYRIDIEVLSAGRAVARRSQIIRIAGDHSIVGGDPALRLPMMVRAQRPVYAEA